MQNNRLGLVALALVAACSSRAQSSPPPLPATPGDTVVTAVSGDSWLEHIHRSFGDTSMGKTGRLGPPAGEEASQPLAQVGALPTTQAVTLRGADLYRLNCQGCHGESGQGAPPEINSLINPLRATSVVLVVERMKKTGMDISYRDAATLAQQSSVALLDRLQKGGENMPAFQQLNRPEVGALLAYLKQLADTPGAKNEQSNVRESQLRVGELIVKSTCHTCHSAVGPNPGPRELADGAIPPLSTLTRRKDQSEFIRKVTRGEPVLMGTPPELCRGRMPVFYYLSEQEAADVYLYLLHYPPTERDTPAAPLAAATLVVRHTSGNGLNSPPPPSPATGEARQEREFTASPDVLMLVWVAGTSFVLFAILGGLFFTIHIFKRLSAGSHRHGVKMRSTSAAD